MTDPTQTPLRYNEEGNVHLDFHGAVNTTIDFIVSRYGVEAMHEISGVSARTCTRISAAT